MVNYQVGDFLIQIKNSAKAGRKEVKIKTSRLKKAVALVLEKEGYLSEVKESERDLVVKLAYDHKEPVLLDLRLVSRPGLRIYASIDEISNHKGGSILIVSTSKGVVSGKNAMKLGIGGEILAEVW